MGYVVKWLIGLGFIYPLIAIYQQYVKTEKNKWLFRPKGSLFYGYLVCFLLPTPCFGISVFLARRGHVADYNHNTPEGGIIALRVCKCKHGGMFNKKYQPYLQVLMAIPIIAYPFWAINPSGRTNNLILKPTNHARLTIILT